MTITVSGGVISVEDCKKHEGYPDPQYAPTRKIRVEQTFALAEGMVQSEAQAAIAVLGQNISVQVDALLARSKAKAAVLEYEKAPATPAPTTTLTDKEKLALQAGVLDEKPKRGPGRPAKKDEPKVEEVKGPAVQTDLEDFTIPAEEPKAEAKLDDDELLSAPATEITDQQLTDAVTDHNKKHDGKARVGIRTLIGTYNPDPTKAFMLSQIKQEHRQEFLTKLKDVKAD